MKTIKSISLLLVVILLFAFSVFNIHSVKVRFFTWQSPELPLFLILVFAFALGCVAAALWGAIRSAGRARGRRKATSPGERKQVEKKIGTEKGKPMDLKEEDTEKSEETTR